MGSFSESSAPREMYFHSQDGGVCCLCLCPLWNKKDEPEQLTVEVMLNATLLAVAC